MLMLDVQFNLPANCVPPDRLEVQPGRQISPDHVISRNRDGAVASYVRDFTAYDPRGRQRKFYFYYWSDGRSEVDLSDISNEREIRVRELQHLMVRLIYRENGQIFSVTSLIGRLGIARLIARFAELEKCSISEVLGVQSILDHFIGWIPEGATTGILFWLRFLWALDPIDLGYVVVRPKHLRNLEIRAEKQDAMSKQHAPIPSRIYALIINSLSSELDEIDEHKDRLLAALKESIAPPVHLRKNQATALGPVLISRHGLEDFFEKRGLCRTTTSLRTAVAEIYRICKLQIHVFSGMRDAEAKYLPYHCISIEETSHGRNHCFIIGTTTKLNAGERKQTQWVTTERDGLRAIRIAQEFSSFIYGCVGVLPSESEETRDIYPLFLSVEHMFGTKVNSPPTLGAFIVSNNQLCNALPGLRQRLRPIIEEEDLAELEEIDPFRAWRDEPEYALGQPWPLKPHQLRRSLALFANASGLVRLSSLRRQLQHITREMSLYYARGSAFAINFIAEDPKGFKRHVAAEWQSGEQEAQYIAFVKNVLHSDEPMYGPAGVYYERQRNRGDILLPEEFKKQVKMGRLAYRSSPFGGCTNPNNCESTKGLRLMQVACLTDSCEFLVGKHSKVIRLIELQRATLRNTDPASITYEIENEDLRILVATENKWRSAGLIEGLDAGEVDG
jgi:hypothetical protein